MTNEQEMNGREPAVRFLFILYKFYITLIIDFTFGC